jgi:hypothetical protein
MARGRRVKVCPAALALCAALAMPGGVHAQGRGGAAQGRGGGAAGPAATGRRAALKDVTGYWVSVVAEHWHLRMLVPPKGNFEMLPLNAEARRIANAWDRSKDEASGEQCKSYGAATIMRVPGRLHIHWADDNTLQVDTDSGTQTRLFHFGGAAPGTGGRVPPPLPSASADRGSATRGGGSDAPKLDWQGYSVATWERAARGGGEGAAAGDLKVTTTRMRPGYLRKNGVPYSENATLEEFVDMFSEPNGDTWLVLDSIVRDPQYLTQPYLTSVAFKKLPGASGWDPTPCRTDQPR